MPATAPLRQTLDQWFGRANAESFDPVDLSVAMNFQRDHPAATWDEAHDHALANRGKQRGSSELLTKDEALAVMERMQESPGRQLDHAIQFVRESTGTASTDFPPNVGITPQRVNPNPPATPVYPPPIYGPETMPGSNQLETDARRSDARAAALRRLWELVSNESRAIGAGPRVLARALAAFAESSDWVKALQALDSEESLDKAAELMQAGVSWEEAKKRTNYAG
jgi:hypothetical protein